MDPQSEVSPVVLTSRAPQHAAALYTVAVGVCSSFKTKLRGLRFGGPYILRGITVKY